MWVKLFGGSGSSGGGSATPGNCAFKGIPISDTVVISGTNIRVNKGFAAQVTALVQAARTAGITLTANSSYRSPDEQIALRKANCGTSSDAIYKWPALRATPRRLSRARRATSRALLSTLRTVRSAPPSTPGSRTMLPGSRSTTIPARAGTGRLMATRRWIDSYSIVKGQ